MKPLTVSRLPSVALRYGWRASKRSILNTDEHNKVDIRYLSNSNIACMKDTDEGLVLAYAKDEAIISRLVEISPTNRVYGVRKAAYLYYLKWLDNTINILIKPASTALRNDSITEVTINTLLKRLSVIREHDPVPPFNQVEYNTEEMIYMFTMPPQIMYHFWMRTGNNSPVYLWELDDANLVETELISALSDICTRMESLSINGCLACPYKGNCLDHLSGEQLDTLYNTDSVELPTLKGTIKRKFKSNWVPPSTLTHHPIGSVKEQLGLTEIHIPSDMQELSDRLNEHKDYYANIHSGLKFINEQCKSCSRKDSCLWGKYTNTFKANGGYEYNKDKTLNRSDICQGKLDKPISVTVSNFESIVTELLHFVMNNRGYYKTEYSLKQRQLCTLVAQGLLHWVKNGKGLDKWSSAYYRKYAKAKHKGLGLCVIPREVFTLFRSLELSGGYMSKGTWWDFLVNNTNWFEEEDLSDQVPGLTIEKSEWLLITRSNYFAAHHLTHTVDCRVQATLDGTKVGYRSKYLDSEEQRMLLVMRLILWCVIPSYSVSYGGFGSHRDSVPKIYRHTYYDYTYKSNDSFGGGITLDNVLAKILEDIGDSMTNTKVDERLYLLANIGR